jgi:WD40 repeat protein
LAYAPDGLGVVAATTSGNVLLWDLASGREQWSTSVPVEAPQVFVSLDNQQVVVQGQLAAWWLSRESGSVQSLRQLDGLRYWGLYVSPDGASLVTIGTSGEVDLWVGGGPPHRVGTLIECGQPRQRRIAFSRGGRLFCTGGDAGMARVYRVPTGEEVLAIPDRVFFGVFSPDDTRLVAVRPDRQVQVWDLKGRAKAMTLRGHLAMAECAAFTPDGRRIATADWDGVVKIWSGSPGRSAWELGAVPKAFKLSPDGRIVSGAPGYGDLRMWNSDSGRLVGMLQGRCEKTYWSDFSPDGRWLATTTLDPLVRLWDVASGGLVGVFQGHTNVVRTLRFSPDGRSLATADNAGVIRLWDVEAKSPRLSIATEGNLGDCVESVG